MNPPHWKRMLLFKPTRRLLVDLKRYTVLLDGVKEMTRMRCLTCLSLQNPVIFSSSPSLASRYIKCPEMADFANDRAYCLSFLVFHDYSLSSSGLHAGRYMSVLVEWTNQSKKDSLMLSQLCVCWLLQHVY